MSATKYTAPHMMLHWLIAVAVGIQIIFADAMGASFDAKMENIEIGTGWTGGAIFHALLGATIGILMLWRLALRLTTDIPPPPESAGVIQTVSRATHWLFYAILIGMPIVGALAWFIPSETLAEVHDVTGKVLIGLIVLHIAGALYHHFVAGDKAVLRRMLPR
ncbi:cytochrome b561 [Loktanella atrilutea]|uniref:Cytochrome b561 n=1 Tax=Loktanella atrilutea TaxID=366533 RepID=A0A1M4SY06_LOKAT|nr:cytochrome b/b6 domain-containing protein [Loktanella atrilutea]SHE37069.1 cytochrome b561 [Loktanella atrilutea]